MVAPPFFTIITSTRNASTTLPRLLESLAAQTCRDFNWIIQDGASSDATMDIVEQYNCRIPEILADSCRDNGIYDAWNKAIEHWQNKIGKWVLFLGADDELAGIDVLDQAKSFLVCCKESILYAEGSICFIDYSNNTSQTIHHTSDIELRFRERFYGMPLFHPAVFHKGSLLHLYKFDTKFRIAGDYDFILRTWTAPQQLYVLPLLVTNMALGGISSAPQTQKISVREKLLAIRKNLLCQRAYLFYFIIVFNTYSHPVKIAIKKFLLQFSAGKLLWKILHKLHECVRMLTHGGHRPSK